MSDITKKIRAEIHDKLDAGEIVDQDRLAAEIIEARSDIHGSDVDFYKVCAFAEVRNIVRSCIKKFKPSAANDDDQLTLPGFDHLQKAYFIRRDDRDLLIPVTLCTDAELLARAREYDDMAKGCADHALELRKYVRARTGRAA